MFAVMQSSPGCPSLALEAWALQLGGRHLTHHMQASQALQRAGRSMGLQGTASALTGATPIAFEHIFSLLLTRKTVGV